MLRRGNRGRTHWAKVLESEMAWADVQDTFTASCMRITTVHIINDGHSVQHIHTLQPLPLIRA
jgi:hypothetical protein